LREGQRKAYPLKQVSNTSRRTLLDPSPYGSDRLHVRALMGTFLCG